MAAARQSSVTMPDVGATKDTTEDDLLIMFKRCSIRAQNKLVNVVEFINLVQEPEEAAFKFISRGVRPGQDVSYSDKLCSHVIVRGLESS